MGMELELFFKKNQKVTENVKMAVTEDLCDKEGNPLLWEIRKLKTKEVQTITKECMKEKIVGRKTVANMDEELFVRRLIVESVVFPDLNNAALQDSYGVKCAEDLVVEMVSNAGDFMALNQFLVKLNNIDKTIEDKVEEAKN